MRNRYTRHVNDPKLFRKPSAVPPHPPDDTERTTADGASVRPSLKRLMQVWLLLGFQTFGGGGSTIIQIRRAVVEQEHWMTDAEFVRDWALCQIAPGINIIGLIILIGRRLGGSAGVAVSLFGLLAPSVSITLLLTMCYAHFQGVKAVQAAVKGIIPATVGLGMLTAYKMAVPLLAAGRRNGKGSFILAAFIIVCAGLATATFNLPVIAVLCLAGGVGAIGQWACEAVQLGREDRLQ